MIRTLALVPMFFAASGCVVLAPVVDHEEPIPMGDHGLCDPGVTCAQLSDPPPTTFEPSMLASPQPTCTHTPMSITLTDDTTLDATDLHCVALDVTFAPEPTRVAERAITLQIIGGDLTQFDLHARSTTALAALDLRTEHLTDVTIRLEGAIRMSVDHTNAERVALTLGGSDPIEPPEALLTNCTFVSFSAVGPRAPIRFRDSAIQHASLQMRSIAFERGQTRDSHLEGELIELLDAIVASTDFAADRIIATGGSIDGSYFERCGSLTLAATSVRMSAFERCLDPIDAQSASLSTSVFHGDIGGNATIVAYSVVAGDVLMEGGTLLNDALCGASVVHVGSISCPVCTPVAPSEICLSNFDSIDMCPGFCRATCPTRMSPMHVDEATCAAP